MEKDSEARDAFQRQVWEEQERRRAKREVLFLFQAFFFWGDKSKYHLIIL
jgi:hypothetical protein